MGFDFFNLFINIKVVFFDLLIEKRLKLFKINQKDIENNSNWNWQYDFDFNIRMDVKLPSEFGLLGIRIVDDSIPRP